MEKNATTMTGNVTPVCVPQVILAFGATRIQIAKKAMNVKIDIVYWLNSQILINVQLVTNASVATAEIASAKEDSKTELSATAKHSVSVKFAIIFIVEGR